MKRPNPAPYQQLRETHIFDLKPWRKPGHACGSKAQKPIRGTPVREERQEGPGWDALMELNGRLNGMVPGPNGRTDLGLGLLPAEEQPPGVSKPGDEYVSEKIHLKKWPFSWTLWLLTGGPGIPDEPP